MPSDAVQAALAEIRRNVVLAESFVAGLAYEEFLENHLVFYGVTRCLEIISEASRRLLDALKARHPHIPWVEMTGAGNVYRHNYEDVQHRLV